MMQDTIATPEDILLQKIALSMAKGMQGDTLIELLRRVGSVQDFFAYSERELAMLAGVDSPIFARAYRDQLLENARKELAFVNNHDIKACFLTDKDYPRRLSACSDAPAMLYQIGKADLDSAHVVAIVGTRHATPYGVDFTKHLVEDLAKMFPGIIILSGLAFGIDVAAHTAAISSSTPTVGVLGHGLQMIYPAQHRSIAARILEKEGALVTKYGSGEAVRKGNFLSRNLVVAGLADCVIVVESDYRGGSMSTAHAASLYGREVMALPGRITDTYSNGTNKLISKNVANLITNAEDVAQIMNWEPAASPAKSSASPALFQPLTPVEQQIYDFIKKNPQCTENDLCISLALPYAKICSAVFSLEMKDYLLKLPGGLFSPLVN